MAAARSVFRSSSVRNAASQFASAAKTSSTRSSFRFPSAANLLSSSRIFRCPAELSACLESMQPFHTATASALMTSMLAVTCRSSSWAPDAGNDDV
ncbi:protein NUCLEAR FUSION DEFECTIVE 6, mitochondrial-like isoform X1 [Silene latifolia]|uniref:protein NUCLEAR FUSION DEFECTIVE 6, mitochondrial-like isoform X1 n=1 Tax=Silene latifolia TaxID=37657 RepID=UPI003D77D824